eukprot:3945598-Amphidinium_carterae.1
MGAQFFHAPQAALVSAISEALNVLDWTSKHACQSSIGNFCHRPSSDQPRLAMVLCDQQLALESEH